MNSPVNFELAQLLKENGYIINGNGFNSPFYVLKNTRYHKKGILTEEYPDETCCESNPVPTNKRLYVPTIGEVVMWLYTKHGIWIWSSGVKNTWKFYTIGTVSYSSIDFYDSPTDAYSAAIEYTLKNLIK